VSVRVRLLGRPRIEDTGGQPHPRRDGPTGRWGSPAGARASPQPRGQKAWAVLARLALSDRAVTRHELVGELFAEADDPLAALRWCLADLRRCLGEPRLLRGNPVSLPADAVWVDVRALQDGTLPVADIGPVLLDGVEPRNSPGFDTWLLLARGRCAARSAEALRQVTLHLLAAGDAAAAMEPAGRAAALDPLDESAQELFLRTMVAAGHTARATVHLALCEATFAREGLVPSAALRAAAVAPVAAPRIGVRAGVVAGALLRAGTAALDAGSVDAGIETLRRAAEEAERAGDAALQADVLRTLGGALVHAVRGFDGEGAVVLHRARALAESAGDRAMTADILRELAFVDVQAGRHGSSRDALREAGAYADAVGSPALTAGILAVRGMEEADRGRHLAAVEFLTDSARTAGRAGRRRQEAWSVGLLARSLLLAGDPAAARAAAERSIDLTERDRWNAYLPWPQAVRADCLAAAGEWDAAQRDAEQAFALACQLGDPCWEGMAARALAMAAAHAGDRAAAQDWIVDARRRCDRVPDRYVWVSNYVALGHLEIATRQSPDLVPTLAARLYTDALRADLPEFIAWALVYRAESGDRAKAGLARTLAAEIDNPVLRARADALDGPATGAVTGPRSAGRT
jgi:DNA-binding SARP family transcriptional activator